MVFVYTAMGVLCVEHANVLELCYIELLSGDSSPYSIFSVFSSNIQKHFASILVINKIIHNVSSSPHGQDNRHHTHTLFRQRSHTS